MLRRVDAWALHRRYLHKFRLGKWSRLSDARHITVTTQLRAERQSCCQAQALHDDKIRPDVLSCYPTTQTRSLFSFSYPQTISNWC